jgi:hypothetical protein
MPYRTGYARGLIITDPLYEQISGGEFVDPDLLRSKLKNMREDLRPQDLAVYSRILDPHSRRIVDAANIDPQSYFVDPILFCEAMSEWFRDMANLEAEPGVGVSREQRLAEVAHNWYEQGRLMSPGAGESDSVRWVDPKRQEIARSYRERHRAKRKGIVRRCLEQVPLLKTWLRRTG